MSNAFRNGLLPQISEAVNQSRVSVDVACLNELRRHAAHAERQIQRIKEAEEQKRKDAKHRAHLTMVQTPTQTAHSLTTPGEPRTRR